MRFSPLVVYIKLSFAFPSLSFRFSDTLIMCRRTSITILGMIFKAFDACFYAQCSTCTSSTKSHMNTLTQVRIGQDRCHQHNARRASLCKTRLAHSPLCTSMSQCRESRASYISIQAHVHAHSILRHTQICFITSLCKFYVECTFVSLSPLCDSLEHKTTAVHE